MRLPTTTTHAVRKIADDLQLSPDVIKSVIDAYIETILKCLEQEMPFNINNFGKFYFMYRSNKRLTDRTTAPAIFHDKVHRELGFRISASIKHRVNGWVHDLGMKNNIDRKELLRLAIKPDEISKIRRVRILEEQRAVGFTPDLLFEEDNLPAHDRSLIKELDNAPTLNDLMERLGVNIDKE